MNQSDTDRWFLGTHPITSGNDVQFFIYYRKFFQALAEDITKAISAEHFIYIAAWSLDINTALDTPSRGRVQLNTLLHEASDRKVSIRALLMYQPIPGPPGIDNKPAFSEINSLSTGAAILDNRYLVVGTHHQKIVVICNSDGLIGYCGGMDIDEVRMGREATKSIPGNPPPWADGHCRIKGEGALQLLKTFCDRWEDHPWRTTEVPVPKQDITRTPRNVSQSAGSAKIQIVHTYPRGSARRVGQPINIDIDIPIILLPIPPIPPLPPLPPITIPPSLIPDIPGIIPPTPTPVIHTIKITFTFELKVPNGLLIPTRNLDLVEMFSLLIAKPGAIRLAPPVYAFAPNGDHSIYNLVVNGIDKSKHTIYIEDQYMVGSSNLAGNLESVSKILGKKVADKDFKKLIILTNAIGGIQHELFQTTRRRRAFWNDLTEGLSSDDKKKKVGFFVLKSDDHDPPRTPYVHSKVWVFDDEFAIIGSANCDRRGYSHDSEVAVGIAGDDLPRKFRQELWFRHLNAHLSLNQPFTPLYTREQLADFEQSANFWFTPDKDSLLQLYNFDPDPLNPDRYATDEAVNRFLIEVADALRREKGLKPIESRDPIEVAKWLQAMNYLLYTDVFKDIAKEVMRRLQHGDTYDFEWDNFIDPDGS